MLYIPFHKYNYVGGPSTFMQNLKNYLDKEKYPYSDKYNKKYDIFFPISFDFKVLNAIKNNKGKVVQRLDGIYQLKNKRKNLKKIYKQYADFVVFQSDYSLKQSFYLLGKIPENKYVKIINGVNLEIFFPDCNVTINRKIKFVTTGNFRKLFMLEPIVKSLDKLKNKYDFELHIAGPIILEELKAFLNREYIVYHNNLTMSGISYLLRKCNIFLYSVVNPPCPNAVLEAISCGLPVVSYNSGSMSELCYFSKDLLVDVSNELFQNYKDFDFELFRKKIEMCVDDYEKYRKIALDNADLYSFDKCGAEYIKVFDRIRSIKSVKMKLTHKIAHVVKKIINR